MATRKERLESRGWTIHAEKNDSWFIATNQHGIRYILRFHKEDAIPMLDWYCPRALDREASDKFFSDPQALLNEVSKDSTYKRIYLLWSVPEAEIISDVVEDCRRLPHSTLISLSGKWDYEDVSKIYFELIDLATTMPEAETWQEVWAEYQKGL